MPFPSALTRVFSTAQFRYPAGIAVDRTRNRLVLANTGGSQLLWGDLTVATPTLRSVGQYGTGATPSAMSLPVAVVVESGGHLVVLDGGLGRLSRYRFDSATDTYSHDDQFLGGNRSVIDGQPLNAPTDLALVGAMLYVLDAGNGRVVGIDLASGAHTTLLTAQAQSQLACIAVSSTGTVVVSDTQQHRLLKYRPGVSQPESFGRYGTAPGQFRSPRGLAFDAADNLYVVDSYNRRIQVFDALNGLLGAIEGGGMFAAPQRVSITGADELLVSDSGQNAVLVFGPVATTALLRLNPSTEEFGSVGVGYSLERSLALYNDGVQPLHVSAITSDAQEFAPLETAFTIGPAQSRSLLVRFTPTQIGAVTGVLSVVSDSVTGAATSYVVRGVGTAAMTVDAVLILDRSGSMLQSAGATTKMAALHHAAKLFVDLTRAGDGDRVGVVSFDATSQVEYPLSPIVDTPTSNRAALHAAIDALTPRGATSIGAGLEQARPLVTPSDTPNRRTVFVVVSDGKENMPPFVKNGGPADARVDLTTYQGITIYTVGLGLGTDVDVAVLTSLASHFRGFFSLTEDRWLTLQKFFIEIFADAVNEFVALDPDYECRGSDPVEIDVELGRIDHRVTFAVYWADPAATLDLELETPLGTRVRAEAVHQFGGRHAKGRTYEFYRLPLPLKDLQGAWNGRWRLRVSGDGKHDTIRFGVSVIVASDLQLTGTLKRSSDATGEPALFEVVARRYGRPVALAACEIQLERPRYSRGALLGDVKHIRASKSHPAPLVADAVPAGLAAALTDDERFRERTATALQTDKLAGDATGAALVARIPALTVEGSHNVRAVAYIHHDGVRLRRECRTTFAAVAYPSPTRSRASATLIGRSKTYYKYLVRIHFADRLGNPLGPGLSSSIATYVNGRRRGRVRDVGAGSYEVVLLVKRQPGKSKRIIAAVVRGCRLEWPLPALLKHTATHDQNASPTPGGFSNS